MSRKKYIQQADADRVIDKSKAALAALADELARAIAERITPGMKEPQIRAIMEAEIELMLKGVNQVEAETYAQIDSATVEDDGEGV